MSLTDRLRSLFSRSAADAAVSPHALRKRLEQAAALMGRGAAVDRWVNQSSGVGVSGRDRQTDTEFAAPRAITKVEALRLWRGSSLIRRALGKKASVALSRGVELSVPRGDTTWLEGELERLGALQHLLEGRWWGNLYGGALVIANCDGGGRADEELDLNTLRQVVNLRVVDRHQVAQIEYTRAGGEEDGRPPTTTRLSRDGQPELYRLHPAANSGAGLRIHASRVFRFNGAPLPFEGRRENSGWDDSLLVGFWQALSRRGIGLAALATQLQDSNVGVWKIQDFHNMVLSGGDDIDAWLEAMVLFRSVLGDYALDAEAEDFEYKSKPLKEAVEVFEQLLFDLAAEVDMPFTELYGRSPAGMNATGESDRRKWHETIDAFERPVFARALRWLLPMLQAQTGAPGRLKEAAVSVSWPSLETLTAMEEEERRSARTKATVELVKEGIVTPEEARRRLRSDPTWELDEGAGGESAPAADAAGLAQVGQVADALQGDGSKVGLFLRLPAELSLRRPPLSEDSTPPHVTFLVVGDVAGREAEFLEVLRGAINDARGACRAILGDVDALVNRGGQLVMYQHVQFSVPSPRSWSRPLHALRDTIVERLRQRSFSLTDISPDDWLPHLTLAYLDDPEATWTGEPLSGSWHVDTLEVWGLPDVVRLPLDGRVREPEEDATDATSGQEALAEAIRKRADHLLKLDEDVSPVVVMSHYRRRFSEADDAQEARRLAELLVDESFTSRLDSDHRRQIVEDRTEELLRDLQSVPKDFLELLARERRREQ